MFKRSAIRLVTTASAFLATIEHQEETGLLIKVVALILQTQPTHLERSARPFTSLWTNSARARQTSPLNSARKTASVPHQLTVKQEPSRPVNQMVPVIRQTPLKHLDRSANYSNNR